MVILSPETASSLIIADCIRKYSLATHTFFARFHHETSRFGTWLSEIVRYYSIDLTAVLFAV